MIDLSSLVYSFTSVVIDHPKLATSNPDIHSNFLGGLSGLAAHASSSTERLTCGDA